jgi:hypothetical protein
MFSIRASTSAREPHHEDHEVRRYLVAKNAKQKPVNSKHEIQNSKQFQMIKTDKIPNQFVSDFDFWLSALSISVVSDFELRISDFD